jgi:two-component system, OmpR family, response regulator QseB
MRLLVIEDETRIAELVKTGLGRAGFTVDVVGLCGDARAALAVTSYDAAIVDLGLPTATASNCFASCGHAAIGRRSWC